MNNKIDNIKDKLQELIEKMQEAIENMEEKANNREDGLLTTCEEEKVDKYTTNIQVLEDALNELENWEY